MATTQDYHTSMGSDDRSAASATKFWAIVFSLIFALGVILIASFFFADSGTSTSRTQPAAERVTEPGL